MRASELIGERIRELRAMNGGWSQRDLADRLLESGFTSGRGRLHHSAIAKIEAGTRRVDLDELLALAYVLNVAPVHLFVPPLTEEQDVRIEIVPGQDASPSLLRRWIRGLFPLGQDARRFYSNVPWGEWERATSSVGLELRNAFEQLMTVMTEADSAEGESQAINALMDAERALGRMRKKLGVPDNYPTGGIELPGEEG